VGYIVNQDIIDRVGNTAAVELTTDSGTVVDTDVLDQVRQAADGEVDSYLARRVAVPVDTTAHPELVAILLSVTLSIAVFNLRSRRDPVPESASVERGNAIKWLQRVANGEITLPAASSPATSVSDGPVVSSGSSPATASRENMGVGPSA